MLVLLPLCWAALPAAGLAAAETASAGESPVRRCVEEPTTGRCLPNFLVIGAQKSGTSTLYQLMRMHPQVVPAKHKELAFFAAPGRRERCDATPAELAAYAEHGGFPRRHVLENVSGITGEWSATYYACACCPSTITQMLPGVRLVAILREPVSRASSRFVELRERILRLRPGPKPLAPRAARFLEGFGEVVLDEVPRLKRCLLPNRSLEAQVRCTGRDSALEERTSWACPSTVCTCGTG